MQQVPNDRLSFAAFQETLHTRFRISAATTQSAELTLVEAIESSPPGRTPSEPGQPRHETYSLVFSGPPEPLLAQSIYTFEHERLGRFELFIVPIGRTPLSIEYQAVFNNRLG